MKRLLLLVMMLIFFIPLQCLSQSFQTIGAMTATLPASQDATTLNVTPSESTGGTYNIFQVSAAGTAASTSCAAAGVYFAIQFNGNMCFSASNLQLATTGAAPYLYLNGIGSDQGQPYLKQSTAQLVAPTCAISNSATGGSIAAGTYYLKCTYVNAAGETNQTNEVSTTTTGSTSTLTITAPGAAYSAFGYQTYVSTSTNSETLRIPTSSNCTLASQTFGGNAVCAPTANATFTSLPTAGVSVPTTNSTGGAYIPSLAPYAEALGFFVAGSNPGDDAPLNSGLLLPGGEGINLTSGTTTTAQTLACLSASETASQCGANATNVTGVFTGSGQYAAIQISGIATINLASSATTTEGDYACTNATAGTIVDNGGTACAANQQVGFIAQTNGTAISSVPVFLRQAAGGSSANAVVTNPSATQTITPGSSNVEGLVIQSNGGTSTDAFDVYQNGWNPIKVDDVGVPIITHSPQVDNLIIDTNRGATGTVLQFNSVKDHITDYAGGNDISGTISISSATSGSYTFAQAYSHAPVCVLTPTSNPGSLTWWVTASTTAVTANLSASGTLTFNYHCFGAPN